MKHRICSALIVVALLSITSGALANTPPVASFAYHASPDGSQTTIVLDASASYDPDGTIGTYQWLFGDGYSGSGVTTTHTFPSLSTYTVTLLVTDNGKATHLLSQTIDLSSPSIPQDAPAPAPVQDVVVPLDIPVGNRSGERAPAFALPNQAGEIVQLSEFLGHLVLLEFWSSSCSACQAAMPHVEELRTEFADRGLIVVTITINRDAEGDWQYLTQRGYTDFIMLRESDPVERPTMAEYGVSRIPHALVIDYQGVIRYTGHVNLVQPDMIEALL